MKPYWEIVVKGVDGREHAPRVEDQFIRRQFRLAVQIAAGMRRRGYDADVRRVLS